MKFIVDAQLPPALVKFLKSRGREAIHVQELGMLSDDDVSIWRRAHAEGAAIITKDEDFMDQLYISQHKAPIVLIRVGNCSNRALLHWFAPLLDEVVKRLEAGENLIELT